MFKAFIAELRAHRHPRPYDDVLKNAPIAVKIIAGIAGVFDFFVGIIIIAGTLLSAAMLFGKFADIVSTVRRILGH